MICPQCIGVAVAVALAPAAGGGAGPGSAGAPAWLAAWTALAEVRKAVEVQRERLQSFRVEYELREADPDTGELKEAYLYCVVMASGRMRFTDTAHVESFVTRETDVLRSQVYFTGDCFSVYHPLTHKYEFSRRQASLPVTRKTRSDFYLDCLGWWPPGDDTRPPSEWHKIYLHEALRSSRYRVLSGAEPVGGRPCRVLEHPGKDKIWMNPEVGWGIRLRELTAPDGKQSFIRYELGDYREVAPSIWLPHRVRRVIYDLSQPAGDPQKVSVDARLTVLAVRVNDISDGEFQFRPGPGTLVIDRDTGSAHQVPGGLDFLDTVVRVAIDHVRLHNARVSVSRPSGRSSASAVGLFAAVTILATLNLFLLGQSAWRWRPGAARAVRL